ncbi:MAG: oxygen-independent coproporphyrinogen III oxidase [Pseudomonadota bacterium]
MEYESTLSEYGLFDAMVPRYTSFPPANRFQPEIGRRRQVQWLETLPPDDPVSVYVHIPFCRRLCWFCACRTQGTKTRRPMSEYLDDVITEIETVKALAPDRLPMARLHLGGGTPTFLSPRDMERLLAALFNAFPTSTNFEFSVEIDPTEAPQTVLDVLSDHHMTRASIGVQDFDARVQEAIGRRQTYKQTAEVVERVRSGGVNSLNIDLLYGLPYQTQTSLLATVDMVTSLKPDRLALYGYAHVPHMSKRQVMIPSDELPDARQRYASARLAHDHLVEGGYLPLGIDHFALPSDTLAQAAKTGSMRRNFQGYSADPCATLLGFGASAISTYPSGYSQNVPSTAGYRQQIQTTGRAAHKGYVLSHDDAILAELINSIMCDGKIATLKVKRQHPRDGARIDALVQNLALTFPKAVERIGEDLRILPQYLALARVMAAHLDQELSKEHRHSLAI